MIQNAAPIKFRQNRVHSDHRNHGVDFHCGDHQIADILYVYHVDHCPYIHDLRKWKKLLNLPFQHISGGNPVDADDQDTQPVILTF